MSNSELVNRFVGYGIKFRESSDINENLLNKHVLYLSDCAARNLPEKFLERVTELYIKTGQKIPRELLLVKDDSNLMSAFNIGLFGTDNDKSFIV